MEIRQRFRRLLQRLVIEGNHLREQPAVVRIAIDRRRKLAHRGLLHRRRRFQERGVLRAQQLDRVPETDALRAHYPVDHRAAGLAGAQTVP